MAGKDAKRNQLLMNSLFLANDDAILSEMETEHIHQVLHASLPGSVMVPTSLEAIISCIP